MATTKKKSKIAMPPAALNNAAMLEAINKGGSVRATTEAQKAEPETDKLKSFTFKIYESELAQIRDIQDRLPKRDRISIHNFVVAAVKDKIAREQKRTN
ncbi:hypothetical protein [Salmonirosea aquatica]|uniref:Uncharacterized protein n=1 Tax=Salmonirosea aquatica TaxID=2654236 RepID=A0A7C9BP03_9BACT|nr:hypothetical protein [Cytophagaceae bacterium SJW1-29]MPR37188.1 hypothetical protein [Cytophagaceae bacterium SJW1-29]